MYKRMFDDFESYTSNAEEFERKIRESLKPILEKYIQNGFSSVDIKSIVFESVTFMLCQLRTERNWKLYHKKE